MASFSALTIDHPRHQIKITTQPQNSMPSQKTAHQDSARRQLATRRRNPPASSPAPQSGTQRHTALHGAATQRQRTKVSRVPKPKQCQGSQPQHRKSRAKKLKSPWPQHPKPQNTNPKEVKAEVKAKAKAELEHATATVNQKQTARHHTTENKTKSVSATATFHSVAIEQNPQAHVVSTEVVRTCQVVDLRVCDERLRHLLGSRTQWRTLGAMNAQRSRCCDVANFQRLARHVASSEESRLCQHNSCHVCRNTRDVGGFVLHNGGTLEKSCVSAQAKATKRCVRTAPGGRLKKTEAKPRKEEERQRAHY